MSTSTGTHPVPDPSNPHNEDCQVDDKQSLATDPTVTINKRGEISGRLIH